MTNFTMPTNYQQLSSIGVHNTHMVPPPPSTRYPINIASSNHKLAIHNGCVYHVDYMLQVQADISVDAPVLNMIDFTIQCYA